MAADGARGADRETAARRMVADSWRRSFLYGLDRERIKQRHDEVDTDSRFVSAVRPVLESLPSRLGGSDTGVVITDPRGRITLVWAENPEHRLSPPGDLPGGDAGPGNRYLYARTPWGSTVELVTYPSPQAYEAGTTLRRWRPPATADHTGQQP